MPYFSIIIPVYNVAPYLRECLDSVLKQTFTDWEAICVDDGSTDESGAILDEYAAKDKRFRVIHQANAGVSAARNRALEEIKGEWVGFLDADDVYRFNLLEACCEAINFLPSTDIVRFEMMKFDGQSDCKWPESEPPIKYEISEFDDTITIDSYNGAFGGRVYRVKKIKDIRFLPFIMGEDRAWLADVIDSLGKMVSINQVAYGYRNRPGSAVNTKWSPQKFLDEIGWRMHVYSVWNKSKKTIDKVMVRQSLLIMSEWMASIFFNMEKGERNCVYLTWQNALNDVSKFVYVPLYFKVMFRINSLLRIRCVTWVTLFLPYYLKRKGIHR